MTLSEQAHLRILNIIEAEPEISQRQLAERLGVSLGKANYLLTPEGIGAKMQLTRGYLARKEQEYVAMKGAIEAMRAELREHDARG